MLPMSSLVGSETPAARAGLQSVMESRIVLPPAVRIRRRVLAAVVCVVDGW
jgi:hypothetical protein